MAQNPRRQIRDRAMGISRKGNELVKLRGATVYVLIESNGEWWRYKSLNFPPLSHDNLEITHDFNSDNFITVGEAQTNPTPPPQDYTGMPSQMQSQWMTPPPRSTLPATTAPVDHTAANHLHHLTPQPSLFPVHGRNRRTQPHNTQAQQPQQPRPSPQKRRPPADDGAALKKVRV